MQNAKFAYKFKLATWLLLQNSKGIFCQNVANYGRHFANICGLLRIYELYVNFEKKILNLPHENLVNILRSGHVNGMG